MSRHMNYLLLSQKNLQNVLSFLLFLSLILLNGCKQRADVSRVASFKGVSSAHTVVPLLLLVGGNASCASGKRTFVSGLTGHIASEGPEGMSMEAEFKAFSSALSTALSESIGPTSRNLPWIKTCFRLLEDGREIAFMSSNVAKPSKTVIKNTKAGGEISVADLDDWFKPIIDRIEELRMTDDNKERPIIVAGHSFGGWTSIQLVSRLPARSVTVLTTMDPISRKTCTPERVSHAVKGFLSNYAQQDFESKTEAEREAIALEFADEGCRAFPPDIDAQTLKIQLGEATWQNFYQDFDIFLHSGPGAGATNRLIDEKILTDLVHQKRYSYTMPAHVAINHSPEVWVAHLAASMRAYGVENEESLFALKSTISALTTNASAKSLGLTGQSDSAGYLGGFVD